MKAPSLEARARRTLAEADIEINGSRPWDLTVHNPGFYTRILREGSLGLGESYMDAWWDCARLDEFFARVFRAGLDRLAYRGARAWALVAGSALFNRQTRRRSRQVAQRHYDVGNDLFQQMLGRRMIYTTGRWPGAATLEEAEEAKLDFVCRQLALEPGMTVLDIGCGWGGFARFAAERYGARVKGITVSREQADLARRVCAGWPVEIALEDYREERKQYDRLVSLGMFEHVGYRNYRTFFVVARRALGAGGRFLLSSIGSTRSTHSTDPWIERYIFPNSQLPSIEQVGRAIEELFAPLEWHDWAADYDRTLMAWYANFSAGWDTWRQRYGERFCRMWSFYLLSCAAAFRERRLQDWQIDLQPI